MREIGHPGYAVLVLLRPCHLKEQGRDAGQPWGTIIGLLETGLMCGCKIGMHAFFSISSCSALNRNGTVEDNGSIKKSI